MLIHSSLVAAVLVGFAPSLFTQNSDSLPPELEEAVQRTLREERFRLVPDGDGAWVEGDPDREVSARFSADGIEVLGQGEGGVAWSFGLELTAWGRGEELTTAQDGPCEASGTRFEIQRGDLLEWYVNDEHGVEQGFTLAAPPTGTAATDGLLRLVLAIEGGFSGEILEGGRDARFSSRDDSRSVLYGGLRAWGADGCELDAHLACEEGRISILVDDEDAAYPVTIDPWIWTREGTFLADQRLWAGEALGASVALDGDTALIAAYRDHLLGSGQGCVRVYVQSGGVWSQTAKLVAADGEPGDGFGESVSLDGGTALVGADNDDDRGEDSGSVYVFVGSGSTWVQEAKLTDEYGAAGDRFGTSVSLDGDSALLGAPYDNDVASNAGSSHVFVRTGSIWAQQARILASDGEDGDQFGRSVSLDGDSALIGAPGDDSWAEDWGSVYVFTRSGSTWTLQMKGTTVDASRSAGFGWSVSLDGDTALVGAPRDYQPPNVSGSAHVFVRNGTTWTQEAKLTSYGGLGSNSGASVSLDGDTALVGGGSAYVFTRSGTSWTRQISLASGGPRVALDNGVALVGIPGTDIGRSASAGSAYLYTGSGSSWPLTQTFVVASADYTAGDNFGMSTAIDVDTALVGAYGDDDLGTNSGAAYVFIRDGSHWIFQTKLRATDGRGGDWFGFSVAVDDGIALLGARGSDEGGANAGAVYVFNQSGTTWTQEAKLLASDAEPDDELGFSVDLDGDTAVVGALGDDDTGSESGAAYVFTRHGTVWGEQSKLTAPDGEANYRFGVSVSVDVDTALIGADQIRGGQAYIFVRTGSSWTPDAKLVAFDREPGDRFGTSVDLDGGIAAIGAYGDDDLGTNSGAVYVFSRNGTSWGQGAKLTGTAGINHSEFGRSLALDRSILLIGAPGEAVKRGTAYVFTRTGTRWVQQRTLYGPWAGDSYARSVSLDGTTALVGAPGHDDFPYFSDDDSGAAYFHKGSPVAHALFRNAGANPESYTATTLPVLGTDYEASIDLAGTTGHSLAVLAGYVAPMSFSLGAGQTALVDPSGPELLGFPSAGGPVASFVVDIPSDISYLGFELFTQAAHVGGVQPFALSNAQDLFIGH